MSRDEAFQRLEQAASSLGKTLAKNALRQATSDFASYLQYRANCAPLTQREFEAFSIGRKPTSGKRQS